MLEELLQPISADKPAGEDQSGEPEWQAIKEARRADDKLERGSWDRPLKESDWHAVKELSVELLSRKTKDLRLAIFLMEANLNLDGGFTGLADGLRLITGLVATFWDSGLFPLIEDGDVEYRSQALAWLGDEEKLPKAIRGILLTKRSDSGRNYSWLDYQDARLVGWEKDLVTSTGDIDESKQQTRQSRLSSGHVSQEMFEAAVTATPRPAIESISRELEVAWTEFLAVDKCIDDKFGGQGPGLHPPREALEDCRKLIQDSVKKKREQEPDPSEAGAGAISETERSGFSFGEGFFGDEMGGAGSGGSWHAAENLIKSGNVKEGLAEMTRLAASEHGRIRFHRKLRLAETCFAIKRDRLAIAILEELAKEIDEHHLESWESAELVGRVWGRLYRSYKSVDDAKARAGELFDRLCSLDPWQALRWEN
jgi:type VI secretion system ImpA family protein